MHIDLGDVGPQRGHGGEAHRARAEHSDDERTAIEEIGSAERISNAEGRVDSTGEWFDEHRVLVAQVVRYRVDLGFVGPEPRAPSTAC